MQVHLSSGRWLKGTISSLNHAPRRAERRGFRGKQAIAYVSGYGIHVSGSVLHRTRAAAGGAAGWLYAKAMSMQHPSGY